MKYIDLHTHTNYSDAVIPPEHSLAEAEKLGLSLFSISDHNTVEAYRNLTDIRHIFGGKILPAAELSTTFKGDVIEILGYGIDTEKLSGLISKNYFSFYLLFLQFVLSEPVFSLRYKEYQLRIRDRNTLMFIGIWQRNILKQILKC